MLKDWKLNAERGEWQQQALHYSEIIQGIEQGQIRFDNAEVGGAGARLVWRPRLQHQDPGIVLIRPRILGTGERQPYSPRQLNR